MDFASAIPEGQITATIYTLIKENKYLDAIGLLQDFQQGFPNVSPSPSPPPPTHAFTGRHTPFNHAALRSNPPR